MNKMETCAVTKNNDDYMFATTTYDYELIKQTKHDLHKDFRSMYRVFKQLLELKYNVAYAIPVK